MMFWTLALIVTLAALTALFYAGRSEQVNGLQDDAELAAKAHHRAQLAEITADMEGGRLSAEEAEAAKAELAREILRTEASAAPSAAKSSQTPLWLRLGAVAAIGVFGLGIYTQIGSPQLPAQPLALRELPQAETPSIDVADAIAKVEAQLVKNPSDVRGWAVLAPIYMRQSRFDDAVRAYRQVLALAPPTADVETDLAEAIMMANNGDAAGEPLALLQSAAARDPNHVRSRFYLAGEATRTEDFENAVTQWQSLLALSAGGEPWVAAARSGLAAAQAGLRGEPVIALPQSDPDQNAQILAMVEGLATRLADEGGTIDEWTRLVRSYLVLGQTENAQSAYDTARAAYPDATTRQDLDQMAQQAGLTTQ